jgi:hypothetical protein
MGCFPTEPYAPETLFRSAIHQYIASIQFREGKVFSHASGITNARRVNSAKIPPIGMRTI